MAVLCWSIPRIALVLHAMRYVSPWTFPHTLCLPALQRPALPWSEMFPTATPMSLDLLAKMLTFDQHRRITVDVGTAGSDGRGILSTISAAAVCVYISTHLSVHACILTAQWTTEYACLQEALAHPYLQELHSRAREPICRAAFDFSFERDYPDEMPQTLLQVRACNVLDLAVTSACFGRLHHRLFKVAPNFKRTPIIITVTARRIPFFPSHPHHRRSTCSRRWWPCGPRWRAPSRAMHRRCHCR